MRINQPATKEQADAIGFEPWKPGTYDFEVKDATDEVSRATGNEMIKLTLHVFNADGDKRTVFDYLVNSEKSQFKIRHFAEAVGLTHHYEKGELDCYDIVSKTGRLTLAVKPAKGEYPAGNSVRDYIASEIAPPVRSETPAARQPKREMADIDDEIPF